MTGAVIGTAVAGIIFWAVRSAILRRRRGRANAGGQADSERMVGEWGVVVSRVGSGGTGLVRIGQDMWSARTVDESAAGAGERVRVVAARGDVLFVSQEESVAGQGGEP